MALILAHGRLDLATRSVLPAAEAFFRRTITSTGCVPEHIVTDKATFYPSAIRSWAPDAKHTASGVDAPVGCQEAFEVAMGSPDRASNNRYS